jgi:putative nucleotidyltransferase with HDIG domain
MKHFHQAFLWRLLIACCLLAAMVAFGGHLVAIGKLRELNGHDMHSWVALITVFSGLATAACLYPLFVNLHRRIFRFADDVVTGNLELAAVMGAAIAQRDSETGDHNFRVTLYAFHLAEALDDPGLDMRALLLGAFLHDVGKIGIRDSILLKPGRLTDEEMAVMRTHVGLGLEIIGSSRWLQLARKVIEGHHERFDGKGYPQGLSGTAIPLEARLFSIVDVFDALTSERPYKRPLPLAEALACLQEAAGSQFDAGMVAAFCRVAEEAYRSIHLATEPELQGMLTALVERHRRVLYDARPVSPSTFKGDGKALMLPDASTCPHSTHQAIDEESVLLIEDTVLPMHEQKPDNARGVPSRPRVSPSKASAPRPS